MDIQPNRLPRTRTTRARARRTAALACSTAAALLAAAGVPGGALSSTSTARPGVPGPTEGAQVGVPGPTEGAQAGVPGPAKGAQAGVLAPSSEARGEVSQEPPSATRLDQYIAGVARAWESYTAADGRVNDPLDPADTGDNYGVILLADVMLRVASRTSDSALEATGVRILTSALTLPLPDDPFNLFALAATIHDGEQGDFSAAAWEKLAGPLSRRAGQIGSSLGTGCLSVPGCYDNWRLVWSAGASLLQADGIAGAPGSLAAGGSAVRAQIESNLGLAVSHAGAPLQTAVGGEAVRVHRASGAAGALTSNPPEGTARELSDPGNEPSAYELFSSFMLEVIGEHTPGAMTRKVARVRRQADRYALRMMAPDGQLSLSGRSLDQSWVQAAAAALGARRAALEPANAAGWRAYAERAVSYLLASYPIGGDGLLPIVPGLALEWSPSIMDGYAALNQYEGLTLWLLSDALAQWPRTEASRAPLPADSQSLLANDLGSSGLVWGRAKGVWWELSGRTTSSDPRAAQGLVAVKVLNRGVWGDLLGLRPLRGGPSSAWTLRTARGGMATPTFSRARGTGGRVTLSGNYTRVHGRALARVRWTLETIGAGVRLSMSMPRKASLQTTVWLAGTGSQRLSAPAARLVRGACLVTASGRACPTTILWSNRRAATLEVSARP